ncbi:MIT C-terminal domain-containing protein [Thiospirochaeta perfilievii]|uniref:MIT C-terminal domain-containing protein n=1 Tax=Thiospirochaeta perfilievii TaxID=252967 RepID=UPI001FEF6F80|nr:MIT C-terminal domain-containing protein [Thiospirochaeta perfilievii]
MHSEDPVSDSVNISSETTPVRQVILKEGNTEIRDNQEGISYENLFGDYFVGAKEILIVDPFIRMPHQFRNLMELIKVILTKKEIGEEITIHVVTGVDEDYRYESDSHFTEIGESISPLGVYFSYEINNGIHDRSIEIDDKWKILLGRGLDMFQKPLGRYDIAEIYPEIRKCRECNITYIKK